MFCFSFCLHYLQNIIRNLKKKLYQNNDFWGLFLCLGGLIFFLSPSSVCLQWNRRQRESLLFTSLFLLLTA